MVSRLLAFKTSFLGGFHHNFLLPLVYYTFFFARKWYISLEGTWSPGTVDCSEIPARFSHRLDGAIYLVNDGAIYLNQLVSWSRISEPPPTVSRYYGPRKFFVKKRPWSHFFQQKRRPSPTGVCLGPGFGDGIDGAIGAGPPRLKLVVKLGWKQPWKLTNVPLKRDYFNRKVHLPTIDF